MVPGAIRFAASQVPLVGTQLGEGAAAFAEERLSRYSKSRTSVTQFRTVLRDTAVALSEANGNRPLMVMIDELDRCRPSYAVELLEVAKHLFSVDRIVFVLAVNCDQLAHSVKALYGNDFDADGYLRRFFDVDFKLPAPERRAFIHAQLQATGIYDYFDQVAEPESYYSQHLCSERVREKTDGPHAPVGAVPVLRGFRTQPQNRQSGHSPSGTVVRLPAQRSGRSWSGDDCRVDHPNDRSEAL